MTVVDRALINTLFERERQHFIAKHPKSQKLAERAKASLLSGVPMNWMRRWASDSPIFIKEAEGAHITDVDGHRYLDLCLGDTGAMTGHAPPVVVKAIIDHVRRGITFMLPTEDALRVG